MKTASKEAAYNSYSNPPVAEFINAMRWAGENLPDTARIINRKPELYYIYSGGKKSTSFPRYATPEEIIKFLDENRIQYLIIDRWFRHAYVTLYPAIQKYPDKFKTLYQQQTPEPAQNNPPTFIFEYNPKWGYTGDMLNGKRNGQGTLVMQDGRIYKGAFVNGNCEGYGVMTDANGNILAKGIWKNNQLVEQK